MNLRRWLAWIYAIALGLLGCVPPALVVSPQVTVSPMPTLMTTATSVREVSPPPNRLAWEIPATDFATPMPGLAVAAFKSSVTL
jgi:hypothetical protein